MHDASLLGRLSRDPELVTTPRGIVSADLRVAVDGRGGGAVLASPRGLEEQAKGLQRTPHRHLAAAQARRMGTDHGSKRFQLYVVPQAVQFISGRPDDRHEQRPIPDGRQDVG